MSLLVSNKCSDRVNVTGGSRATASDGRHACLYWFVVRSASVLVRPCGSVWWIRLPLTTPFFVFEKPEVFFINCQFSQVAWQNPAVDVRSMFYSWWSVLVSQSVSQLGAAAQWIRALKISQVLWLSGEVCIDGNTKTSCCWQFVIMCVCECFCFLWMNCKCLQHIQSCLTHPPPHL